MLGGEMSISAASEAGIRLIARPLLVGRTGVADKGGSQRGWVRTTYSNAHKNILVYDIAEPVFSGEFWASGSANLHALSRTTHVFRGSQCRRGRRAMRTISNPSRNTLTQATNRFVVK